MARLLIVEDDGDLQQLLSLALTREGYEVHYAFNGQEGLDKALALQPNVVLLDIMLPVLNGREVLVRLSENTLLRDIPVIVMTAHGDKPEMLEDSLRAQGARAYLRKPFDMAEMKSLVRRVLAQYPRRASSPSLTAKGQVRLDKSFRTVWVGDKHVATLSPLRASVLEVLISAKGSVRREKLLQAVWGKNGSSASLDKTIQRLREDLGLEGARIQTTPDGYELVG